MLPERRLLAQLAEALYVGVEGRLVEGGMEGVAEAEAGGRKEQDRGIEVERVALQPHDRRAKHRSRRPLPQPLPL